ncbi:MAG: arsenate reductase family protein [Bacteroidales bacterium]|nr:arsenate reductase family protein [Bacteroidales bacterium]
MIRIYHNPRCRKSRAGLEFVKLLNQPYEIIDYLKNPLSEEDLTELISFLGIKPHDLLRKQEAFYKDELKGKNISQKEMIEIMTANPTLIKRPIVVVNKKAVWADPPENILNII